jgi:hypothetical protein
VRVLNRTHIFIEDRPSGILVVPYAVTARTAQSIRENSHCSAGQSKSGGQKAGFN